MGVLNATGGSSLWTQGTGVAYLTITTDNVAIGTTTATSKLDVTTNSLATVQTNTSGLAVTTTTAAVSGTPQISPAIRWRGFGWGTTAGTSQPVDWRSYVLPVEGATPSASLIFQASINGGGYSDGLTIRNTALGNVTALNTTIDVNHGLRVKAPNTGAPWALVMYNNASSFVGGFEALTGKFTFSNSFMTIGTANTATAALGGREMQFVNDEALQSGDAGMRFQQLGNKNITSSALVGYRFAAIYNPTSGNANLTHFNIVPTWNQTGSASGDLIGIDYAPVTTSVLGNHYGLLVRSGLTGLGTATPTKPFT